MGSNFKIWWHAGRQRMPLVQRDIKRFSSVRNSLQNGIAVCSDRGCGRFAKSDQVASCLLRREYAGAMPVRREVLVARNRRRLKLLFVCVLLWWVAGLISM